MNILTKLRKEKKLTQTELARISGVPQTTIAGIEVYNSIPRLDTAMKLAKALGIPVEELLEDQ